MWASAGPMAIPPGFRTATWSSARATIRTPAPASISARIMPTRPKPWTTTRAPSSASCCWAATASMARSAPRLTASRWPRVPPMAGGLPVTTARTV